MQLFRIASSLALLAPAVGALSVPSEEQQRALRVQSATETLGSIITEEEDLAILASLINSTGLLELTFDETIDPWTVFAPVNDAFVALTGSAVELTDRVLNRADFALHRVSVLLTHVTSGALFVCNLVDGQVAAALNGQSLTIGADILEALTVSSPGSSVAVVDADFEAVNGVLHKVDGVLLPSWWGADLDDVIESLAPTGYSTIDSLFLDIGGIGEFLCEGTVGTVFLPTDEALAGLATPSDLFEALSAHIVLGVHTSESLVVGDTLQTLAGTVLEVTAGADGSIIVGGSTVVLADVLANDGIVHGTSLPLPLPASENSVSGPADTSPMAPGPASDLGSPATPGMTPTGPGPASDPGSTATPGMTPAGPGPASDPDSPATPGMTPTGPGPRPGPGPATPGSVDTPGGPPTRKQMKKAGKKKGMKVFKKKKDKLKEEKLSNDEKKVKIKKETTPKNGPDGKGKKGGKGAAGKDDKGRGGKRAAGKEDKGKDGRGAAGKEDKGKGGKGAAGKEDEGKGGKGDASQKRMGDGKGKGGKGMVKPEAKTESADY